MPFTTSTPAAGAKAYIVSYCANWDGGAQERDTAMEAVRAGLEAAGVNSVVSAAKSDSYPVKVSVSEGNTILWSAPQRALFRKYAADRSRSISEIAEAVRKHATAGKA